MAMATRNRNKLTRQQQQADQETATTTSPPKIATSQPKIQAENRNKPTRQKQLANKETITKQPDNRNKFNLEHFSTPLSVGCPELSKILIKEILTEEQNKIQQNSCSIEVFFLQFTL